MKKKSPPVKEIDEGKKEEAPRDKEWRGGELGGGQMGAQEEVLFGGGSRGCRSVKSFSWLGIG